METRGLRRGARRRRQWPCRSPSYPAAAAVLFSFAQLDGSEAMIKVRMGPWAASENERFTCAHTTAHAFLVAFSLLPFLCPQNVVASSVAANDPRSVVMDVRAWLARCERQGAEGCWAAVSAKCLPMCAGWGSTVVSRRGSWTTVAHGASLYPPLLLAAGRCRRAQRGDTRYPSSFFRPRWWHATGRAWFCSHRLQLVFSYTALLRHGLREAVHAVDYSYGRKDARFVCFYNVAVGQHLVQDKVRLVNVEHNVELALWGEGGGG